MKTAFSSRKFFRQFHIVFLQHFKEPYIDKDEHGAFFSSFATCVPYRMGINQRRFNGTHVLIILFSFSRKWLPSAITIHHDRIKKYKRLRSQQEMKVEKKKTYFQYQFFFGLYSRWFHQNIRLLLLQKSLKRKKKLNIWENIKNILEKIQNIFKSQKKTFHQHTKMSYMHFINKIHSKNERNKMYQILPQSEIPKDKMNQNLQYG